MKDRLVTAVQAVARRLVADRLDGQGMAEYGLILAGVALLAIVAVFALGPKVGALLNTIGSSLS